MKLVTVLCVLVVAGVVAAGDQKYTNRFDSVNVKEILENRRLLIAYLNCILDDKAKCTPEGRELKSHIKDALETYCKKCTDIQREWTRTVIGHLINNEKVYWDRLVAKYDPHHVYTVRYEKELKSFSG